MGKKLDPKFLLPERECTKCGKVKKSEEFGKGQYRCKMCINERYKKIGRTQEEKEASKRRQKENWAKNRQFVWDFLKEHSCIDCGESDPVVLHFDHKDPTTKYKGVAHLKKQAQKTLIAEMEKCEVRCANCHRRKTSKERNWYKAKYEMV